MSDYLAAQITIGGCISRALAPRLCKLIGQAHLMLDWEEPFAPGTAEDLLAARRTIDGEWLLQLGNQEAPYGSFVDLEEFLMKHEIPFDRQTDPGHGYHPCLVTYRPRTGKTEWLTTSQGEPAVLIAPLWEVEEQLHAVARSILKAPRNVSHHQAQLALSSLRQCIPPRPEELPTFEVGKSIGLRKAA